MGTSPTAQWTGVRPGVWEDGAWQSLMSVLFLASCSVAQPQQTRQKSKSQCVSQSLQKTAGCTGARAEIPVGNVCSVDTWPRVCRTSTQWVLCAPTPRVPLSQLRKGSPHRVVVGARMTPGAVGLNRKHVDKTLGWWFRKNKIAGF